MEPRVIGSISVPELPPDRGQLLTAQQVADEWLQGARTAEWVRRNVRPAVKLGHHTYRWYEADVRGWLESHRITTGGGK